MMRGHLSLSGCGWLVLVLVVSPPVQGAETLPERVEFNRDIRPILSDKCFHCHGPDKAQRKADLRLDIEEGAFADLGNNQVIAPGDLAHSELYQRITASEPRFRMPPANSGRELSERDIALIRRWIEQGAKWQKHWSFIPPQRPELPQVKDTAWPKNGIDYFILARLEREGLKPSPEADKVTLIRRVTLDLTGLPPTPAEVDAFVNDTSPNAYEKVVDRLLASPRFGERLAAPWLDAARYADTSGYQSDGERFMWRWRDWVIEAFNQNKPFDEFTIEQLAGDLLPNPTLEQRLATGFNRNHRGNAEGGIIPEEYAVEYVADRVETTATVWLGLTLGCARCHEHKYDPVSQKEFYQLFAFFNNVPERGKAVKYGNSPPLISAPTRPQQERLRKLEARLDAAESKFRSVQDELAQAQQEWELTCPRQPAMDWYPERRLVAHYPLDDQPEMPDTTPRFQAGTVTFGPGRLGRAALFDGQRYLDAGDVGDFGFYDKFSLSAWIRPEDIGTGTIISRMKDTARAEGYSLCLHKGKVQLNLVKRWLDDALRVETEQALTPGRWYHVLATYDGSRWATGVNIYLNGEPAKLKVHLDELNQSFRVKEPLRLGSDGGSDKRFRGAIDEVRVYDTCLTADQARILATPDAITDILAVPVEKRTANQTHKLRGYYLEHQAPFSIRQAYQRLRELREQRALLIESFPTVMVMEEMPTPRDTFVLIRGEYDKPGDKVMPDVLSCLTPFPLDQPRNRLGLARWLVSPDHPLTARVTVNRYWQMLFGTGLVKTAEDFGSQGEWPSHPELLDWLAIEFMHGDTRIASNPRESVPRPWDIQRILKTIVMSATYRQSSKVTPQLWQKDPDNRLLARGPRVRLTAEMVRDQALFVSGLLVEKIGGPSVKPYQPPGLWSELTSEVDYVPDEGEGLYRRSLYTFWKRTVSPPSMMTFDASARETCIVRETRTNTPLQALNLMNDVTYVEAARLLAQRVMRQAGPSPEERLTLAFRLATARPPKPDELKILVAGYRNYLSEYTKNRTAAVRLLNTGASKPHPKLDVPDLAATTAVTSLILNLDETITKE
ncbi:MAG: DUF1553 domain-containing protein [Gemmataceae bacterium]